MENRVVEMINDAKCELVNSYAPYSGFNVAAALLTKSGKIYTGCNIENASYSMTICAERTAFFKAVSEGEREFDAIVIMGGHGGIVNDYLPPCGACRQVMAEFCKGDFIVIFAKDTTDYKRYSLKELLPECFNLDV